MKIKALIIEDEIHNYRLLHGMIKNYRPDWDIEEPLVSVEKSVAWFNNNPSPDIVFMDIQLVDGICFSIFEKVRIDSLIIFTTAYDEYALRAFDVNSIDYLLKPVKEIRLNEAINKFEKYLKIQNNYSSTKDYTEILKAIQKGEKKYRKRFLVARAKSYQKVNVSDIALFYTENRITYAVAFDGVEYNLELTMEKLEEQLDPGLFFRANRSNIINSEAIHKMEAYFGGKLYVKLVPPIKHEITISRLKATEFKNWIGN